MAMWIAPMITRCAGRRNGSTNTSPSRRAISLPDGTPFSSSASPVARLVRRVAGSFRSSMPRSSRCASVSGCTNTSIWPPHASPTSNATSSATPNAAIFGVPFFRTFCASSNTAPSMQPLETEPAIFPDRVTTIFEPSGRGLEPHVSTTVASAISSPSLVHCSSSPNTSLIGSSPPAVERREQPSQVLERAKVVRREEVVAVGQRGGHAARERLVSLRAQQRVEPDQPVRGPVQVRELRRELLRIAAVPAVTDDHDHGTVSKDPARPVPVEVSQRVTDPGTAAEVVHALADRVERSVQVAVAKQARDPGQPRRENERLEVLPARDRVGEDHEQARVALHRAAHVAKQDQRTPAHPGPPSEQRHDLPAGMDRLSRRAAKVEPSRARRAQSSRPALRDPPRSLLEQPAHLLRLLPRHVLEVLVAQQLLRAVTA